MAGPPTHGHHVHHHHHHHHQRPQVAATAASDIKPGSAVASGLLERSQSRASSEEASAGSMSTVTGTRERNKAARKLAAAAAQEASPAKPKHRAPHGAQLRQLIGDEGMASVRGTMLQQQRAFVQQLFELHKLSQVQQLLCVEVLGYYPAAPDAQGDEEGERTSQGGGMAEGSMGAMWDAGSKLSQPSVSAPPPAPLPLGGHQQWPVAYAEVAGAGGRMMAGGSTVGAQGMSGQRGIYHLPTIPSALRKQVGAQVMPEAQPPWSMLVAVHAAAAARSGGHSVLVRPEPSKQVSALDAASMQEQSVSVVQPPAGLEGSRHAGGVSSSFRKVQRVSEMPQPQQQAAGPVSRHSGGAGGAGGPRAVSSGRDGNNSAGGLVAVPPARSEPAASGPVPADAAAGAAAPKSSNSTLLEAAAAVLRAAGPGALVVDARAEAAPGARPSTPTTSTLAGPPMFLPPPAALMPGMPPMRMPSGAVDPHAAWFAKHFDPAAANSGGPGTGMAVPAPIGNPSAGAAPDAIMGAGGDSAMPAPVRWWQNEAGTFGDVTPSMLADPAMQALSGKRPTSEEMHAHFVGLPPHKKRAKLEHAAAAAGAMGPPEARHALPPSAFKPVMPRKARSKRGSNRLSARDDGAASDDSGSSLNQEGGALSVGGASHALGSRVIGGAAARIRRATQSHSGVPTSQHGGAEHAGPPSPLQRAQPPAAVPDLAGPQAAGVQPVDAAEGTGAAPLALALAAGKHEKSAAGILLSLSLPLSLSSGGSGAVLSA